MNSWTQNKYTALKFSITEKGKNTDFNVKQIWSDTHKKQHFIWCSKFFFYADFNYSKLMFKE